MSERGARSQSAEITLEQGRVSRAQYDSRDIYEDASNSNTVTTTKALLTRLTRSYSGVITALWLRAPRSPMVHACRDPRLPVLFFALLSDPCPVAILVINGLGHHLSQTREKFSRFICSDSA